MSAIDALLLIDLGEGKNRMGGSALAQVYGRSGGEAVRMRLTAEVLKGFFAAMQQLNREKKLLAYHDRSDGGLFVTLVEMAFAGHWARFLAHCRCVIWLRCSAKSLVRGAGSSRTKMLC
jgi:phosphoribosylformylglycinamidine synthase